MNFVRLFVSCLVSVCLLAACGEQQAPQTQGDQAAQAQLDQANAALKTQQTLAESTEALYKGHQAKILADMEEYRHHSSRGPRQERAMANLQKAADLLAEGAAGLHDALKESHQFDGVKMRSQPTAESVLQEARVLGAKIDQLSGYAHRAGLYCESAQLESESHEAGQLFADQGATLKGLAAKVSKLAKAIN